MPLTVTPLQGKILDVIKGSVATVTLFLAFVYLPVIGTIPGLFASAPAAFYAVKRGRGTGLAVVLASCAILLGVGDPAATAIYLLQAGVLSLALPEFLLRNKGGARSVIYSVAVTITVLLIAAVVYGMSTGADLHAKISKGVQTSINQTSQIYQKAGVKGDELKALQDSMHQAGQLVVTIYPALVTVAYGMIACMNLMLLAGIATRLRMPLYVGDFRKYKNPEPLIWLLIVAGFGTLVPETIVHLASLNVLIVLGAVYSAQGFAIISFFFKKLQVPVFIRLLASLLLIFQPMMVLAVAALGVFDLWADFRSPNKQENL
ncbi:YybS family protein [Geomonas sp. Red421]|uniref:YybS family protein n=1 Tax=Geomonas anaerohicana TaxID=2798583 RepID=A0ABS0YG07_9BACT|nr:YybS family protein [Geomonas anaerohicana]